MPIVGQNEGPQQLAVYTSLRTCLLSIQKFCRGTLTLSHTATPQQISDSPSTPQCVHTQHVCLCVYLCLLTRPPFYPSPQSYLLCHPPIYPHSLSVCVCLANSSCPRCPWRGINDSTLTTLQHITTGQVGRLDTKAQRHTNGHIAISWLKQIAEK